MNRNTLYFTSGLFILFFLTCISAQENSTNLISEVENGLLPMTIIEGEPSFNIEERMKFYNVPGISVTVIENFEIAWTKHYGVMDSQLNNPVTDETLFNVGSLSKGAASITILSLVKEGKIELDKDINDQLISWKVPENEFTAVRRVTPRLLMNHSGGAMHHFATNYLRDDFPTITQVLKGEKPALERPTIIDRIPGTEFLYSNPGFAILQQLAIDIEKRPFWQIAKDNVFDVLEMNHTTFEQPLPLDLEIFACAGHRSTGEPFEVKRYYYPNTAAGGLWTTSYDYAKYIIELQKSYQGKSNKVLSTELTKEMLSTHVSEQYGLGVFIRELDGEIFFSHMGDNAGFFAGYTAHLTNGYGAVIFTNSQNGAPIIREINKAVAKAYKWKGYLPEEYKLVELDEGVSEKIIGRYKVGSDEVIKVSKNNGDLYLNLFENEKLYHIGDNKFVIKNKMGSISFTPDSHGAYSQAEFQFTDELGRFLYETKKCYRIDDNIKVPVELLNENKISEAMDAYRRLFSENDSDPYLSENRFNSLGYQYMNRQMHAQAIAVFQLNTEFYPESANCYDSLGEAFMKNGDKESAIKNYTKSIELNPQNQNAVEMIKKINLEK